MLNEKIRKKLEARKDLPTIPATAAAVLQSIDDPNASAASLARIIERDVSLTARVLAVANSPFYGLLRKVSTVELALVILGLSAVKEILLSLVVQRIFATMRTEVLDVREFWNYSVYCGSTARFLARKLGYRVAGADRSVLDSFDACEVSRVIEPKLLHGDELGDVLRPLKVQPIPIDDRTAA